jgi:hypothetical protein
MKPKLKVNDVFLKEGNFYTVIMKTNTGCLIASPQNSNYHTSISDEDSDYEYLYNNIEQINRIDVLFDFLPISLIATVKNYLIENHEAGKLKSMLNDLEKLKPYQRLHCMNFYQTEQGLVFWDAVYNRHRIAYDKS